MWQTWLVMSAARRVICRRIAQTRNKEEETRGRVVVAWIIELNYAAVSSLLDGILAPTKHVKSLQQPESCENRLEVSKRLKAESIALLKDRLLSRHFGIKQLCSWDNRMVASREPISVCARSKDLGKTISGIRASGEPHGRCDTNWSRLYCYLILCFRQL